MKLSKGKCPFCWFLARRWFPDYADDLIDDVLWGMTAYPLACGTDVENRLQFAVFFWPRWQEPSMLSRGMQ